MSKAVVVAEKAHASLGASSASRWMACPGSIQLSSGLTSKESEHSRAGTAAHAVAEMCLRHPGYDADVYTGMTIEGVEITEEMAEAVQVFIDHCRSLLTHPGVSSGIEARISLAALNPPGSMFGTADFWAYDPVSQTLDVADYKNGSGVVVEAKGNVQLRYYGLGVALALPQGTPIQTIRLTIVQPNARHPEGVVRSDLMGYVDLLDFAGELMDAARATLDPAAPLVAGSHCRWCPASAICPAQREQAQLIAMTEFDDLTVTSLPPSPASLPVEILADILPKLGLLEEWIKACKAHAQTLLERGVDVPGQKLVAKRATRSWANETEVTHWLREERGYADEEIMVQRLKSPAQIEKVLKSKKAIPEEWITKQSSGYTMAPTNDTRDQIFLDPGSEFDALPSGE